jgi:alpha-beta hydrolase superfamily lysophospholipase
MIESNRIISFKKREVFLRIFLPEDTPKAILQLNHGLAEHSERYKEFAMYLTRNGYGLYIHDHPGHGNTVGKDDIPGHLPWKTGWNLMLNCINQINKIIRKDFPQTPVFIMGHSMGSLLTRHYNLSYPMYFNGMIISGTTEPPFLTLYTNLLTIRAISFFVNSIKKVKWLNKKFYGDYNRGLKNTRTGFDWLTTDPEQVNKYISDPLCGFDLSLGFFKNLLSGSIRLLRAENNIKIRKNFPTLIVSGKNDPVGRFGKYPAAMYKKYLKQGYLNTELILADGRHELINEKEREKNFRLIESWMAKHFNKKDGSAI